MIKNGRSFGLPSVFLYMRPAARDPLLQSESQLQLYIEV